MMCNIYQACHGEVTQETYQQLVIIPQGNEKTTVNFHRKGTFPSGLQLSRPHWLRSKRQLPKTL